MTLGCKSAIAAIRADAIGERLFDGMSTGLIVIEVPFSEALNTKQELELLDTVKNKIKQAKKMDLKNG